MKRLGWFIGLLLVWSWANAQSPEAAFEHYTTREGLSNDQVKCLLKDRRGFLWFGTFNGLNRFDGYGFKIYKRTATNGLPGNYVIGLTEDNDGYIWVATHRGLCRFDPIRETFTPVRLAVHADKQGDNDLVSALVIDRRGGGWFSSIDSLYHLDLKTLRTRAYPNVTPNSYRMPMVLYPFMDSRERLWMLNDRAVYQFNMKNGHYRYIGGLDDRHPKAALEIGCIYEIAGQIWLGSGQNGLLRYDEKGQTIIDEPDGHRPVYCLTEGMRRSLPEDVFWAAGTNGQLYQYNPAKQQYSLLSSDSRDPLAHSGSQVNEIFRDPQTGLVWLATENGVEKVDSYTVKFARNLLPPVLGVPGKPEVRLVRQDRLASGIYWIAIKGVGLTRWNRLSNTYTFFGPKQGLPTDDIRDFVQDEAGQIWIGTPGGVSRWNPQTNKWRHWRGFVQPESRIVRLLFDNAGRLWLGSDMEGLFVLNVQLGSVTPWPLGETFGQLSPFRVYKFQQDKQSQLWVATSRGLFRIDTEKGQSRKITLNPLSEQWLPSDKIQTTFLIDARNRLWVTGIGFVAQADLNGHVVRTFTLENGLQADHIFGMEEDNSGNLWMTTDYFLHQLNPQTGTFHYYNRQNGLFSNFIMSQPVRDRNGEMFIGSGPAFNHFNPEKLPANRSQPPVVLTGVRVDTSLRIPIPGEPVVLRPDDHTVTLEFTALSYSQPEKNRYAYRIDGVDRGWIETSNRQITYANLDPGTYTFRVKAANNDGIWNEVGTSLTIKVIPAFYQTWWFQIVCGLLAAGTLYAIYRYRLEQRRRLEGIRDRIATDLHDDMGSTLSSIRIFSDVVQQQIAPVRPEAVPILQRISSSATTLSESMQDIIWTIQTKYDSLDDVVTRMREFGLRMAEAKNIRFTMQVTEKFETLRLDVEQRRNLYLIFKESINNAVKYADCRNITVQIAMLNKHLSVTIEDDGKGFDPATVRPGNGLPNLQKRAKEINGQLTVHSASGDGTRVVLLVRV